MSYYTDPVTGLTYGDVAEPDYPAKCRHCANPIRPHLAGADEYWLDQAGMFRCVKDVNHQPMPTL